MYRKTSRASLFLMELIMSILFFSLAAAVCVQLFVKSHSLSQSSLELNHAVVECESLAELIFGSNADPKEDGKSLWVNDTITFTYDKDFNRQSDNDCVGEYVLKCTRITGESNTKLIKYDISFINQSTGETIYSISPSYFVKGGISQ